jgi:hypothetical protein
MHGGYMPSPGGFGFFKEEWAEKDPLRLSTPNIMAAALNY